MADNEKQPAQVQKAAADEPSAPVLEVAQMDAPEPRARTRRMSADPHHLHEPGKRAMFARPAYSVGEADVPGAGPSTSDVEDD